MHDSTTILLDISRMKEYMNYRNGNLFMLNAVGKVGKVFQTRRKSNLVGIQTV